MLDILTTQLTALEAEHEAARAHVYRTDGAIMLLKHLIVEAEKIELTEIILPGTQAEPAEN